MDTFVERVMKKVTFKKRKTRRGHCLMYVSTTNQSDENTRPFLQFLVRTAATVVVRCFVHGVTRVWRDCVLYQFGKIQLCPLFLLVVLVSIDLCSMDVDFNSQKQSSEITVVSLQTSNWMFPPSVSKSTEWFSNK